MARKYVITETKNMTLKQCLRIRENQYRNVNCTEDYCPFEIEQRIAELGTKQAERMVEQQRDGGFDEQLFALLPEGQQLLNLIDEAFKEAKCTTQQNKGTKYFTETLASITAKVIQCKIFTLTIAQTGLFSLLKIDPKEIVLILFKTKYFFRNYLLNST